MEGKFEIVCYFFAARGGGGLGLGEHSSLDGLPLMLLCAVACYCSYELRPATALMCCGLLLPLCAAACH